MHKELVYRNPWYSKRSLGPEYFRRNPCIVYTTPCGRGQIVMIHHQHFDMLIDGRVVAQLAGKNPELLSELIKAIDGEEIDYLYADRAVAAYKKGVN